MSVFENDTEYQRQIGLDLINASSAYSEGATGDGITVAVIDTGTDATHPDLVGQVSVLSTDVHGATRASDDIDVGGHGTLVAGIIAAAKDNDLPSPLVGQGIHGVAFESTILDIRADVEDSCGDTGDDCTFRDPDLITAIDYAIANGANIINMSLGGELAAPNPALEAAVQRATDAGVLVVIASGNDAAPASDDGMGNVTPATGTSPNDPAYMAGDARFNGLVVAVGAIDPNRNITEFSNRAGEDSKNFYLLAPGDFISDGQGGFTGVVSTGLDDDIMNPDGTDNDDDDIGDYWFVSGTSFAAPHVAGGLALVLDAFPNLTPEDALAVLLDSADDYVDTTPDAILGIAAGQGVDNVSGVGIMNLQAAFQPIGTTSMSINGQKAPLQQVFNAHGGAFGDWMQASNAFEGLVFTDKYNRGFSYSGQQIQSRTANFVDLDARNLSLAGEGGAVAIGGMALSWHTPQIRQDPTIPYEQEAQSTFKARFAFSGGEVQFGRGSTVDPIGPRTSLVYDPASGHDPIGGSDVWAMFARDLGPVRADLYSESSDYRSAYGVGLSHSGSDWIVRGEVSSEDALNALGGSLQSRFGGEDRVKTSAFQIEGAKALHSNWQVRASMEAANSKFEGLEIDDVWTSAWAVGLEGDVFGDAISFTISQPRRSESGSIAFDAPIEMTRTGALVFETRTASLTPSGREIDIEASWRRQLGQTTHLEAAAALVDQANHVENTDLTGLLWVRMKTTW